MLRSAPDPLFDESTPAVRDVRRLGWPIACALALVIACAATAPAAPRRAAVRTATATSYTAAVTMDVRLTHDGAARSYRLHVPASAGVVPPPRPLLVMLHGGGGNPAEIERDTALSDSADAQGFVVAYPAGLDGHWNDGRLASATANDVGFLDAVVADVAARVPITRVFVAGISNGGFMTIRLACERAGTYAGFAAVDASLPTTVQGGCNPAGRPNFLLIAGDADPIVPFKGGVVKPMGDYGGGEVIGAFATRDYFAEAAGCMPLWSKQTFNTVTWDKTSVAEFTAAPCNGEAVNVRLIRVVGGGHTWPGRLIMMLPASMVGPTSFEFSASDEIVEFFAAAS